MWRKECGVFSETRMMYIYNWSQQKLATAAVYFGFFPPNFPILWSGSFVTAPMNLLVHIMLAYLMDPVHAENTFLAVRDQHKLRHTSLGNNSIELRRESQSCRCC
jgi:hypothetical protein